MKKNLAVGFDFTGVLFGESASVFSQGAADCLQVSVDQYHQAYFRRNHELNIDKLPAEIFWSHIAEDVGRPERAQALLDYVLLLPPKRLNMDVVRIAQDLKRQGYRIGILSNNTLEGAEEIRAQGIESLFDVIVVSADVGLMKPDPKIFALFSKQLDVDQSALIFVDDSEKSLSTAEEIGYQPVLFKDATTLVNELKKLEIHVE